MKNLTALAAAATVTAFHFGSALADPPTEPRAVVVNFADLDATNPKGAAILYTRMKDAAAVVCSDLEPGRLLERMQPYSHCVQEALSNAVAVLNVPAVTRYASVRATRTNGRKIQIARGD
jgi:UrcA family protein